MQRFDSIYINILFYRFSVDLPLHLNQNEIHYLRQTFEAEAETVRKNVSHLNTKKSQVFALVLHKRPFEKISDARK